MSCTRPPSGWECSRDPGHDGPCAAREVGGAPVDMGMVRALLAKKCIPVFILALAPDGQWKAATHPVMRTFLMDPATREQTVASIAEALDRFATLPPDDLEWA